MDYERMRAMAEELAKLTPDTVRGYEIGPDEIVMMVPPSRPHERTALRIRQQLDHQLPPIRAAWWRTRPSAGCAAPT